MIGSPKNLIQSPRDQAIAFIAAYDKPDSDAYERHIVRISRTWLSIMAARYPIQGIVDAVMDEFSRPVPDDYGAGWQDLKHKFTQWAVAEDWWNARRSAGSPETGRKRE